MVEIKIGSSGPQHGPYHGPPHHSRPMNKYELIAFFVMLTLFVIIFIIAILSQPKTVPPEPAELPHSGHVINVKGKAQPAVNITPPPSPSPSPALTKPSPSPALTKPSPAIPAPEPSPAIPAPEPSPAIPAPEPSPAIPALTKPSATQPTTSAQPGDIIPDVKAIAVSVSEGNPLPVEDINNASKETFYGKFMHMR